MAKSLVIVESPAKAKTINKYLGENYIVEASVGHVKDLPKGDLAIDVDGGFVPTYELIKGKEDVVKRLQNLAGRCDRVFLATDPDREGEAIAHHIAEEIRDRNGNIQRVLFNEITKSGITAAMRQPRDIDQAMVEAQEARRVMDRLIGYKVSPYLWRTFTGQARGLSAGRVQSVALRLVVERERAINSFIPIEYWNLIGHFRTRDESEIAARLIRFDNTEIRNPSGSATELKENKDALPFISTKAQAEALRERALRESYHIASITRKEVKRNAPLPFTTSTIQQEASRRLRMNTARTMKLAQQLYEGVDLGKQGRVGLITYMRTDSTRVSEEAVDAAGEFIYENYGKEYLPPARIAATSSDTRKSAQGGKAIVKKGKPNVQDAHEAIRPTDLKITPKEARKSLDKELADLYELIWSRFVASQMAAAIFDQTTVDIIGGPFLFRATGRITRFNGWMQVYADIEEEEGGTASGKGSAARKKGKGDAGSDDTEKELETVLPQNIRENDPLRLESIETRQSFTKPPARYTESLLVKEMEAKGIGRPSTYAAIISTIQERGYVEQRERKLYAAELGMQVCDALVAAFPALFDVKFTARMEGDLDTIAGGKATYVKVMQSFYKPLLSALQTVGRLGGGSGGGKGFQLRHKTTEDGRPARGKVEGSKSDAVCEKCGSPMELRLGNYGHYLACLGFPNCRNIISATEDGKPRPRLGSASGVTGPGTSSSGAAVPAADAAATLCDKCGSPMVRRKGRNGGEFYGCSNYPTCTATKAIPLGVSCPGCGQGDIVERVGGRYSSVFYACTRYPECRFTSGLKPLNRPCAKCGNTWVTQAWSKDEGEFIECPRCKAKG